MCIAKLYVVCRLNDQFSVEMAGTVHCRTPSKGENKEIVQNYIHILHKMKVPFDKSWHQQRYIKCLKRNAPYDIGYLLQCVFIMDGWPAPQKASLATPGL